MDSNGAIISDCGLYRFSLWRECEPDVFNGLESACLFVMNNPSTADASEDDPTIRRVRGFAAAWGFHRVYVANTNPFRATDPDAAEMPPTAILEQNDAVLSDLVRRTQWTVAAWGAKARIALADRALRVLRELRPVRAIELTKGGQPKHPLYLPKHARAQDWKPRVSREVSGPKE